MSTIIKIGHTISKSNYLKKSYTLGEEISCDVYGDMSIESPTFILKTTDVDFTANYLYSPTLQRYYHIVDITETAGTSVLISCSVDVLETYID